VPELEPADRDGQRHQHRTAGPMVSWWRACGRELRYVQVPLDEFVAGLAQSGLPSEVTGMLEYLFGEVLDGRIAHLSDGVQRALG
jgi:hypothetical protein